jgi:hypothetical protein
MIYCVCGKIAGGLVPNTVVCCPFCGVLWKVYSDKTISQMKINTPESRIEIKREYIDELSKMNNVKLVTFDGFDNAILGTGNRNSKIDCVIYSRQKMREILMDNKKMSWEEADKYLITNIDCQLLGEHTPIILDDEII